MKKKKSAGIVVKPVIKRDRVKKVKRDVPPELKPCPFCGGEARVRATVDGRYAAECTNDRTCAVWAVTVGFPTKAGAVRAWNKRTRKPS